MVQAKPRVIKDFDKLDNRISEQIKLAYPLGFSRHLITYRDKNGAKCTALPFETDEKYYMVKMTTSEAREIIRNDDDYDDDGNLKDDIREEFEDKYSDVDYMSEYIDDTE